MKKINLLKPLLLLFAVFTFSMCEEAGDIQFVIADDFDTTVAINGLKGETSYAFNTNDIDVNDLLENASEFLTADVESVTLALENYSGAAISGNISVMAGPIPLLSENVALSSTPVAVEIPANASNILSILSSGLFTATISGATSAPIADDNFNIKMTFRIKATVE